jgi:hypothetical protein
MIIPKNISFKGKYSGWWLKKLHAQSIPPPPHSLIFEKFKKSMAVSNMFPEPFVCL